ncbi:DUF4299 domain-containing protein [Treponema sp. OMZ 787]|uniref:DUF4299 domain-containing protein n=1 Tax=Treponema sp. OMZ 787 TaxID=2563669 RepID=UPI0020A25637|nr:DUF4299 domain-containing protein [Treponema sp. OMZ 787]UTC62480.1 DUF4299 domain-containing protein [Treponema sp. OMZ 787]
MSVSFYINNKKTFLKAKAPMKLKECLGFSSQKIEQFAFDEAQDNFDVKRFYNSSIADYECLLCGVLGKSSRGFELSFDKELNHYAVRVFTPSTREDWQIALTYIKDLAKKMGSDIVNERGEYFTAENIEQFNYPEDILFGIKSYFENKDTDEYISFGIFREAAFNRKIVEGFLNSENPIEAFSKFFKDIQYLDAFSAKQMFFEDNKTKNIIGVYALTQDTETILPYTPSVEYKNTGIVKDEDISTWELSLVIINGNPNDKDSYQRAGVMEYSDFIARLPKDKYRFIDAKYILIDALTKEEILSILKKESG